MGQSNSLQEVSPEDEKDKSDQFFVRFVVHDRNMAGV